jgi:hypothetical protein
VASRLSMIGMGENRSGGGEVRDRKGSEREGKHTFLSINVSQVTRRIDNISYSALNKSQISSLRP